MIAVDLATGLLWGFVLLSALVLVPLDPGPGRDRVLAAINLGFVAAVIGQTMSGGWLLMAMDLSLFVLLPVALAQLFLRTIADADRGRLSATVMLVAAALTVFVVHKRTELDAPWLGDLRPVLASVGYSYVMLRAIDLARAVHERTVPVPSFANTINFLLPFHMLAAGPIQAASDLAEPPLPGPPTRRDVVAGLERITGGLAKKFLLAGPLADLFLTDFSVPGAYWWLEVQLFYLWVYVDFTAYSDIAVGIGRLLGLRTPENFDRPLSARNIVVFWERWHISLSLYVRRNVFIPIQLALVRRTGGRRPLLAAAVAFSVAFVLVGLWHGLNLGFFAWGAMHALGLVACNTYRAVLGRRLGREGVRRYTANVPVRILSTSITFEFVALSLALMHHAMRS